MTKMRDLKGYSGSQRSLHFQSLQLTSHRHRRLTAETEPRVYIALMNLSCRTCDVTVKRQAVMSLHVCQRINDAYADTWDE